MEYSQKEIALLSDACVSAFLLVAGADGRITKAETEAFFENHVKTLKESRIFDHIHDEVIMEFLIKSRQKPEYLSKRQGMDEDEHFRTIRQAVALVGKKESEENFNFYCAQMRKLSREVASASKSFFGVLGASVSNSEKEMLSRLQNLFRLGGAARSTH